MDSLCSVDQNRLFKQAKRTSDGRENRFLPKAVFAGNFDFRWFRRTERLFINHRKLRFRWISYPKNVPVNHRKPVTARMSEFLPRSEIFESECNETSWNG